MNNKTSFLFGLVLVLIIFIIFDCNKRENSAIRTYSRYNKSAIDTTITGYKEMNDTIIKQINDYLTESHEVGNNDNSVKIINDYINTNTCTFTEDMINKIKSDIKYIQIANKLGNIGDLGIFMNTKIINPCGNKIMWSSDISKGNTEANNAIIKNINDHLLTDEFYSTNLIILLSNYLTMDDNKNLLKNLDDSGVTNFTSESIGFIVPEPKLTAVKMPNIDDFINTYCSDIKSAVSSIWKPLLVEANDLNYSLPLEGNILFSQLNYTGNLNFSKTLDGNFYVSKLPVINTNTYYALLYENKDLSLFVAHVLNSCTFLSDDDFRNRISEHKKLNLKDEPSFLSDFYFDQYLIIKRKEKNILKVLDYSAKNLGQFQTKDIWYATTKPSSVSIIVKYDSLNIEWQFENKSFTHSAVVQNFNINNIYIPGLFLNTSSLTLESYDFSKGTCQDRRNITTIISL